MKRELTLEDIKFQHLLRKLPSSGKNAPIRGFYHLLRQIPGNYTGDATRYNKYLFEAYYHPSEPDFSLKFKVPVMIYGFYNNCSVGPKELEVKELKDAVVKLIAFGPHENSFINESTGEISEWTSYKAVWDVTAYSNSGEATDFTSMLPATEIKENDFEELSTTDEDFENELASLLLDADIVIIDEETELVFWEANQPNWCVSEIEVEFFLDQADDDSEQANLNK